MKKGEEDVKFKKWQYVGGTSSGSGPPPLGDSGPPTPVWMLHRSTRPSAALTPLPRCHLPLLKWNTVLTSGTIRQVGLVGKSHLLAYTESSMFPLRFQELTFRIALSPLPV